MLQGTAEVVILMILLGWAALSILALPVAIAIGRAVRLRDDEALTEYDWIDEEVAELFAARL